MSSYFIGVDEAGRGPLIGDMIVAGVVASPDVFERLALLGVRDSKLLKPEERLQLYRAITSENIISVLVYIPPHILDRENLNTLEELAILRILGTIALLIKKRASEVHIFIDEIKGRRESIERKLREIFECPAYLTMEPHADAKYPPVATASIVAKTTRDLNLVVLRRVFGDFGSGYSADPITRNWILEYYYSHTTPPLFIRRSWRVLRELAPLWYVAKRHVKRDKSLLEFTKK